MQSVKNKENDRNSTTESNSNSYQKCENRGLHSVETMQSVKNKENDRENSAHNLRDSALCPH
jgi:hypothetical protein